MIWRCLAVCLALAACRPASPPMAPTTVDPGESTSVPSQPATAPSEPATAPKPPPQETAIMDELIGTWLYAKDPEGVIESNSFYEGGSVTFTADGGYAMAMGDGGYSLEGRYELQSQSPEEVVIKTTYSGGRTNVLTLQLRRGSDGALAGFAVLETEDKTPTRYYRAASN